MIAGGPEADALLTQADSARAVATVYTVSLLATCRSLIVAHRRLLVCGAPAPRRGRWSGGRRSSRCLIVFVGRQLPLHWMAWVVPSALAAPLVALGRVQVTAVARRRLRRPGDTIVGIARSIRATVSSCTSPASSSCSFRRSLGSRAASRLRRAHARARRTVGASARAKRERTLGIRRPVRIFVDVDVRRPDDVGIPAIRSSCFRARRRVETTSSGASCCCTSSEHVRAGDWAFGLIGRVACALYWFHPGVWWVARGCATIASWRATIASSPPACAGATTRNCSLSAATALRSARARCASRRSRCPSAAGFARVSPRSSTLGTTSARCAEVGRRWPRRRRLPSPDR